MNIDFRGEFQGGGTRRSYISAKNEHQEHTRTAKQIMRFLLTGVCGAGAERKTPGQVAMACWGFAQPQAIRNGLRFVVDGAQFQGAVEVKKAKELDETYTIDFLEIDPFSQEQTRLMSLSDVDEQDIADLVDSAVERFGLSDKNRWGENAVQARTLKIDSDCNQAIEWNSSSQEDREAVVYQKFVDSPQANLAHVENVYRMARKDWQHLSATERTLLVNLNIDDALAEYKHVTQDSSPRG